VRPGADALGGKIDLTGVSLGIGDQVRDRFGRERRVGDRDEGGNANARDRREVADEIEIQTRVERGIDCIGRYRDQQRIAVRRRVSGIFSADIAGGARPVVDDELLTEPL
jgi:hypothetical protein